MLKPQGYEYPSGIQQEQAVGIRRWAGDALRAYEGHWSDGVTAALRPLDRMVASDEDRLSGVANALAPMLESYARSKWERETLNSDNELSHMLNRLDPSGQVANAYDQRVDDYKYDQWEPPKVVGMYQAMEKLKNGKTPTQHMAASIYQTAQKYGVKPADVKGMIDTGVVPDNFLMNRGVQAARSLLSNNWLSYGVPAAGLGLVGWGLHDALAAQQQAQKESQLPLANGEVGL